MFILLLLARCSVLPVPEPIKNIVDFGFEDTVDTDDIVYEDDEEPYDSRYSMLTMSMNKVPVFENGLAKGNLNIENDLRNVYAQYIESEKENSLAARNPVLAKEWHPEKNGYLTPDKISFSSAKVVWWLGKCGH